LPFLQPPQQPGELGRLGDYRVLLKLGQGGMGVVLQAEDTVLGRSVALKVMKPELAAFEDHRQRFMREARSMAAVEHEHIVGVYQVGEVHNVLFLAMPLTAGIKAICANVPMLRPWANLMGQHEIIPTEDEPGGEVWPDPHQPVQTPLIEDQMK